MDPLDRPEVRWGVGCLLGMTALAGLVIIVLLAAIALEPPTWVQIALGIGLVVGGAALTWLIASALAQSRTIDKEREREAERPGGDKTSESDPGVGQKSE